MSLRVREVDERIFFAHDALFRETFEGSPCWRTALD
jgi:hypothetical protein